MLAFASLPLAISGVFSESIQDDLKTAFSVLSLGVTAYFWFVRANRERLSVGIHQVGGFEGVLEAGQVGVWTGRVFLANRSILPTAIVDGFAEIKWNGRWQKGRLIAADESALPWNLEPSYVVAKQVTMAFQFDEQTTREQVYEDQILRIAFMTVEGRKITQEIRSSYNSAALAQAA
jgi:hypothetical protein